MDILFRNVFLLFEQIRPSFTDAVPHGSLWISGGRVVVRPSGRKKNPCGHEEKER